MTNKCTITSQIIICEIIVHLLVIVQNNTRCTVHVLKYYRVIFSGLMTLDILCRLFYNVRYYATNC